MVLWLVKVLRLYLIYYCKYIWSWGTSCWQVLENPCRYTGSLCGWILGGFQYVFTANSASEWLVKFDSDHINCSFSINFVYFLLAKGGKIGFYYKEHEILPPLPGQCTPKIQLNWNKPVDLFSMSWKDYEKTHKPGLQLDSTATFLKISRLTPWMV